MRIDGVPFEVKTDRLWKTTGNVALEVESLTRSRATQVVYKLDGVRELLKLSMFVARELIRKFPHTRGGDQNHSICLVPVKEFLKYTQKL